MKDNKLVIVMCSECFQDKGLKYEACRVGSDDNSNCPICGNTNGKKLTKEQIQILCDRFFVRGTYEKTEFGGASVLNFSEGGKYDTDILVSEYLKNDLSLLYDKLGIGVFYAAPQMYRIGLISWLQVLACNNMRKKEKAIKGIVSRLHPIEIETDCIFYRMRTNIMEEVTEAKTFDAPPTQFTSSGRLNLEGDTVLYGAFEIETCIHECRATINDTLYIAAMRPLIKLKLLDFTDVSENPDETTPFEMLNIAIRFLFTANSNAYVITQALADQIRNMGYDGVIYPSFFNQVRDKEYKNIALFGRPIEEGKICVDCVNRLVLKSAQYNFILGPAFNSK